MRKQLILVIASALASLIFIACHADPDDAAGQAEELSDPVRRQNAIVNLTRIYTKALADNGGDRNNPNVKAVADTIHDELTQVYIDHPEDTENGRAILDLLKEMRDPRTIPALTKALSWRTEVTEEHAIRAANTLQFVDVPEDQKAGVIEALSNALEQVAGNRGVDNRMRIAFIRTLAEMRDARATPILTKVATTQSEEQSFLINRLAAGAVGQIADPEAVDDMIKCLFLYAINDPRLRMNDVAAEALVRIGQPSLQPLLQLLGGRNADAQAIVEAYIEAVRQRSEEAARQMKKEAILQAEATFTLGALGMREALEPLVRETEQEDPILKFQATIALVRLNLQESDLPRVREILKRVYGEMPDNLDGARMRMQLMAVIRQLYDPAMLPFFLEVARDDELVPDVRIEAVVAYALLANKQEAVALRSFIAQEKTSEEGGYRETFQQNDPMLAAANECDQNLECWIGKLGDSDKIVVRKAAFMLGRLGRGNAAAIEALVEKLDHSEIEVRFAALAALDRIAIEGSQAAVDKIEHLRETEEGRQIWTMFSREALPTQARLSARIGGAR